MTTEKLEEVIIKKPLSEKEISEEFKKFYVKGTYHLKMENPKNDYIVYVDETFKQSVPNDDYWSVNGSRIDEVIEDGEVVQTFRELFNPFKYSNNNTKEVKAHIDFLSKQKDVTIIGYKFPNKMKGQFVTVPQRKRAAPKKRTPAVRVNVRKMF